METIDLIQKPVSTEKSYRLINKNQYTFDVDIKLSKPQIRRIFEDLFDVTVLAVNTHIMPIKKKRLGLNQGYKTRSKRVIITTNVPLPLYGEQGAESKS